MQVEWWYWIVAGVGMLVLELAIPLFVLVWFGAAAVVVGVILAVLPSVGITAQLLLWIVLSLALVMAWFRVFRQDEHKTRIGMADAALGEIGLLVAAVAPFDKGTVRFQKPLLGSETWTCIAEREIAVGTRVKVIQVEGSLLTVEPA